MSVYKRGTKWYFYIKIRGARHRGVIPEARTKYQAQQAENKIRNQLFEGKYGIVESKKTLHEFAEKIFVPWTKDNKRSWRNDVSRLKPVLEFFGKTRLSEITPFMIESYKIKRSKTVTRLGTPRSKTTVNREVQLLSCILTLARRNKEIQTNPCFEVKKFKNEVKRRRYLLPEEEERLMAVLNGPRAHLRLIVLVALHTGMRRGEILRLRKSDLDFHQRIIHVTHTKSFRAREVPMNDLILNLMMSRVANLKSEYLFPNSDTGMSAVTIQHAFETARRLAGLEDFRFHDLRHTASTRMGEAGIDPFTIAEILGHSSIDQTVRYTHSTMKAKRNAVEALGHYEKESGPQRGHRDKQVVMISGAK